MKVPPGWRLVAVSPYPRHWTAEQREHADVWRMNKWLEGFNAWITHWLSKHEADGQPRRELYMPSLAAPRTDLSQRPPPPTNLAACERQNRAHIADAKRIHATARFFIQYWRPLDGRLERKKIAMATLVETAAYECNELLLQRRRLIPRIYSREASGGVRLVLNALYERASARFMMRRADMMIHFLRRRERDSEPDMRVFFRRLTEASRARFAAERIIQRMNQLIAANKQHLQAAAAMKIAPLPPLPPRGEGEVKIAPRSPPRPTDEAVQDTAAVLESSGKFEIAVRGPPPPSGEAGVRVSVARSSASEEDPRPGEPTPAGGESTQQSAGTPDSVDSEAS